LQASLRFAIALRNLKTCNNLSVVYRLTL